jgi:hypothetical protein
MHAVIVTKAPPVPGRRGIEHTPPERLAEVLPSLAPGDLLYLDLSAFTPAAARARLKALLARGDLFLGVVDPKRTVKDITALFHDGVVDYLDGAASSRGGSRGSPRTPVR